MEIFHAQIHIYIVYRQRRLNGPSLNHVDLFLDIYDTPSSPFVDHFINKTYVLIWIGPPPHHVHMVYYE